MKILFPWINHEGNSARDWLKDPDRSACVWWGVLILFVVGWIGDYYGCLRDIPDPPKVQKVELIEKKRGQCDMYSMGCVLSLKGDNNSVKSNIGQPIMMDAGSMSNMMLINTNNAPFYFPRPIVDIGEKPPFHLKYGSDKRVLIKGKLDDYFLEHEPLGSFDNTSFEIMAKEDGCAYSYNIDNYAIEIMNKRKEVCFSLSLQANWRFNGYFVDSEGFIHCYNGFNELHTQSKTKAKKFIEDIKPIFIHYEYDSLGKRLNVLHKRADYPKGNPSFNNAEWSKSI